MSLLLLWFLGIAFWVCSGVAYYYFAWYVMRPIADAIVRWAMRA